MGTKPTRKPLHDDHIRFHLIVTGPRDVEKRLCSIYDTAVSIQCFALMFLSMCANDFFGIGKFGADSIGILLRVGKLNVELLDGCLEVFYLFPLMAESRLKIFGLGSTKNLPCFCCESASFLRSSLTVLLRSTDGRG